MIPIAALLLLAATSQVNLVDDPYQIPAGEWNWVGVNLSQKRATITASFRVTSGGDQLRVALMSRDTLEHLGSDLPSATLAAPAPGRTGGFSFRVHELGDYAILLDNRASKSKSADVHLNVSLDFAEPAVTPLDPRRQLTVILLSFAFFLTVVTYSARKLLQGVRPTPRS